MTKKGQRKTPEVLSPRGSTTLKQLLIPVLSANQY